MGTPSSSSLESRTQFTLIFLLSIVLTVVSADYELVKIGAIVDADSIIGKVERVAMKLAAQRFNNYSTTYQLSIAFNSPSKALPSAYAESAEKLAKKNKVHVIVGMNRWEEAAAVAEVGSQARIPVLSFSTSGAVHRFETTRWPFLIRMASDKVVDMKCIAAILRAYNWTKAVPIYEENMYGGDSAKLALLEAAIREVSAEVEDSVVIPPLSEFPDPKSVVRTALENLVTVESRVFIVLQMSMATVVHLVAEAKAMGFMQTNSVWIFTDSVANSLDLFNTSIIYSMEGALGVKSYYQSNTPSYQEFEKMFTQMMRNEYPEEELSEPGFYAVRAYDSVTTITKAMQKLPGSGKDSKQLLNAILASNFEGLSGQVKFLNRGLSNDSPKRIVNVVGKRYHEIDFWLPNYGFSKTPVFRDGNHKPQQLTGSIVWPGDSQTIPIGWAPPAGERKMIIGVPGRTVFNKFVKVGNDTKPTYSGFCIELFELVRSQLDYVLEYDFVPFNGAYDDLVNHVSDKTYDAVIGDLTILSKRVDKVDFTPAYMESSLSMIVRAVPQETTWIIMKPFTTGMWLVTTAVLIYTMFAVWVMERNQSQTFNGSWWSQIGAAVLYTLSSLFFVQREKLHNRLTRVLIIVWLFVVLILTSSYTASLSSMLTIRQLRPSVTSIRWLSENNKKVGCDLDSFLFDYLIQTHRFKPENIVNVTEMHDYTTKLLSGEITAAFVELPYQKAFFNEYCDRKLTSTSYNYRFGGLAFAFRKGSRVGFDVSKVILEVMESGRVKEMSDKWFKGCSNGDEKDQARLGVDSFIVLYAISGATSSACLLIFVIHKGFKLGLPDKSGRKVEEGDTSEARQFPSAADIVAVGSHVAARNNQIVCSSSF